MTISSCGKSILNQLKIVSVLEETMPGLHIVSNIRFTECKTCVNRQKKYGIDYEEFKADNDARVGKYAANI